MIKAQNVQKVTEHSSLKGKKKIPEDKDEGSLVIDGIIGPKATMSQIWPTVITLGTLTHIH